MKKNHETVENRNKLNQSHFDVRVVLPEHLQLHDGLRLTGRTVVPVNGVV